MIRTVRAYSPPAPPPVTGKFKQDFDNLHRYIATQLVPYQFNYHNDHVSAFNNGPQGEGQPLPAAATLYPTSFIHHVTGSATVTIIAVPHGFPFAGQLVLIADDGFTVQTGGNIAHTKALLPGDIATLTYSPQASLWYLISVVSSLGDITDQSAWQASTNYLVSDSIIDPNGNLQQATVAGTSGVTRPAWNVFVGGFTSDGTGTLLWENRGAPPPTPNRFAVRAIDVNHRAMVDFDQIHVNKSNVASLNSAGIDVSGNVDTTGIAQQAVTSFGTQTTGSVACLNTVWVLVGTVTINIDAANDPLLFSLNATSSSTTVVFDIRVTSDAAGTLYVAATRTTATQTSIVGYVAIAQAIASGVQTFYFWANQGSGATVNLTRIFVYAADQKR